ncbi:MAG: rod shape-determining protein [Oscillospiraceae bacterium]|nr:rod shape-determining protein [Oscillospiraceae bacterium]
MSANIAIDLGTSRTRIFVPNKGILINEPSVITFDLNDGEIIAVGKQAHRMVGRTSKDIKTIYPLTGGVISDFSLVEGMIDFFLKQVIKSKIVMPKAVACIPSEITEVEKRATINAIKSAGIRKVYLIEAAVAAAIGSGIDIKKPRGCMVVNIGAGTTNIAVISLNGLAGSGSIKVAGYQMDEEIIKHLKKEYNLLIGKRMAETIKISIGCVYKQRANRYFRVKGKNIISGFPRWVDISSDEILRVMSEVANRIVQEINDTLERTPPELISDIYSDGIFLSGGSAQTQGFIRLIEKKTGLPVHLANDSSSCVVKGAGIAIKYMRHSKTKTYGLINPLSQ